MLNLTQALDDGARILEDAEVSAPRLNAEVLLMHLLDCERSYLHAHPERELSGDEFIGYEKLLRERAAGKPTQYITGHQEFWGLDFEVTPAVLIPRPETEHSIEAVLSLTSAHPKLLRVVDVGTGSGCIAITLAHVLKGHDISACDISASALAVAQRNAAKHHLDGRVKLYRSDLLSSVPGIFDLIVSNPPYVGSDEPEKVQKIVRDWEPHVAVFGGAKGMDIYERLVPQAGEKLVKDGWLVMEIGYSIEQPIRQLLQGWSAVEIVPDLQGIPRVAVARKP